MPRGQPTRFSRRDLVELIDVLATRAVQGCYFVGALFKNDARNEAARQLLVGIGALRPTDTRFSALPDPARRTLARHARSLGQSVNGQTEIFYLALSPLRRLVELVPEEGAYPAKQLIRMSNGGMSGV